VLAVRAPRREMGALMAALKKHTLARPRLHKVVHLEQEEGGNEQQPESLILLDEAMCSPTTPLADLPPQVARAVGLDVDALAAAAARGEEGGAPTTSTTSTTGVASGEDEGVNGNNGAGSAEKGGPRLVTHIVRLGYPELSAEEALRRILPADVTVPTGFEQAGHIAHLNLRAEHEPHKAAVVGLYKLNPVDP
jgi:tRNA (guanine37-N1)-methyltransferase